MPAIIQSDLPEKALLIRYAGSGAYTDCYYMDVPRTVVLSDYIASFYTSPVFKIERALLGLLAGKSATDDDARELAFDRISKFSAWTVEGRSDDQIMLRDILGRTRSWLMLVPVEDKSGTTRLYFGSAVMPKTRSETGEASFGFFFHALSGFHHWYTRALMRAACSKILSAR